jgi:hypothetical protein
VNLVVANNKSGKLNILQVALVIGILVDLYNKLLPAEEKEKKAVEYVPAYPDWILGKTGSADTTDVHHRVITWDVQRREDGSLGESPFSGKKERRPRLREEITETRDDGTTYMKEVYGKWYDNLLRFDCFAPNPTEAHETLLRFEKMLEIHASWLESQGVSRLLYFGRTSPIYLQDARYQSKACLFFVRTEQIWTRDEDTIRRIELEANDEINTYTWGSDLTGISGTI